jgi:hypothetical protein
MSDIAREAIAAAARQFGPFDGRVWLNTAHQGPLPSSAVEAAARAAAAKAAPHRLADDDFTDVPERLRTLLARLVGGLAVAVVRTGAMRCAEVSSPRSRASAVPRVIATSPGRVTTVCNRLRAPRPAGRTVESLDDCEMGLRDLADFRASSSM